MPFVIVILLYEQQVARADDSMFMKFNKDRENESVGKLADVQCGEAHLMASHARLR
jgi:hypothetical protein